MGAGADDGSGGSPDSALPDAAVPPDAARQMDAPPFDAPPSLPDSSIDAAPGGGAAHLLLSEIVVAPTAAEMIEIYNPTAQPIDLSNYYLSDRDDYYMVVTGTLPAVASDFAVRFPAGATIAPGQYQTVALHGATMFQTTYGVAPSYEVGSDSAAVPDMRAATTGSIGAALTLTDGGEPVIFFQWDQTSDLVKDVDYVFFGAASGGNALVDKTGITADGPDPGTTASAYLADTAAAQQSSIGTHGANGSLHRCRFDEGTERASGGNGILGQDATSEPLATTWKVNPSTAAQRTPNAGPPAGFCP